MVKLAGLVILVAAMAAGADEEAVRPVTISMVAASATNEGPRIAEKKQYSGVVKSMVPPKNDTKDKRFFDPELKSIQKAVADLPYDTYRKVNVATQKVKMAEEAAFEINPTYTLRATPVEKDEQNRIRMDLRIDEKVEVEDSETKKKKVVVREALTSTSSIAPGKPLVLGGLKLKEGRLVIVLTAEQ